MRHILFILLRQFLNFTKWHFDSTNNDFYTLEMVPSLAGEYVSFEFRVSVQRDRLFFSSAIQQGEVL